MARPIDADELLAFPYSESAGTDEQIADWIEKCGLSDDEEVIDRAKKLCWAVIEGFINVIKTAPTLTPPNEWVRVEERLPEYNPGTGAKSYWVAKKDNAGNWQMKMAQYCDYGYAMTVDAETEVTWRDWDFTKIVNVTHWMSLPAPPDRRPPEGEEDT